MTGWVVSHPRKCGISFRKCGISFRKCGISQNREIVDTPTFPLFGLYMWYVPRKIFFQNANFTVFRRYIVSFVSVCIRVVCTYITYIMVCIFFLLFFPAGYITPYFSDVNTNDAFFFQKILIGRSERSERFRSARKYALPEANSTARTER